jgi:hypothetical protein
LTYYVYIYLPINGLKGIRNLILKVYLEKENKILNKKFQLEIIEFESFSCIILNFIQYDLLWFSEVNNVIWIIYNIKGIL